MLSHYFQQFNVNLLISPPIGKFRQLIYKAKSSPTHLSLSQVAYTFIKTLTYTKQKLLVVS